MDATKDLPTKFVDDTGHTTHDLPMIDLAKTQRLRAGAKVCPDNLWHGEHRTYVETSSRGWYVTAEKKPGAPAIQANQDNLTFIPSDVVLYILAAYIYVLFIAPDVALSAVAVLVLLWATGMLRRIVHATHSPWADSLVYMGMTIQL